MVSLYISIWVDQKFPFMGVILECHPLFISPALQHVGKWAGLAQGFSWSQETGT